MFNRERKAQVWIESVLYTLIGLAIIGVLLAVTRPQIAKTQDEFVVQQTIRAMHEIDNKIVEIKQATGNRRLVEFQLSKGYLTVDGINDKMTWTLKGSGYMFSEPGYEVAISNIRVLTEKNADKYDITLTLDYAGSELTVDKQSGAKVLQAAKLPYKMLLENYGPDSLSGKINIDISIS
ncbi:MAG: hypothetical protein V1660_02625 [archaeon]